MHDPTQTNEGSGTPPKSAGLTASERYLARLCERTFLSLWSYPNVCAEPGKELCDLLVVFGDDVFIFSDKSCAFPDTGDRAKDWDRWYRRAIKKSVDQVFGAERWLRNHPDRVFLDARCTTRLPLELPPMDRIRVHRFVVALNASDRCRAHFGGRGSLIIDNTATGRPDPIFSVRPRGCPKGFVHVLDDVSLDIVLGELDTISDFVRYVRAKEAALEAGVIAEARGEEDLLGFYLRNVNQAGEHDFVTPAGARDLSLDPGFWESFRSSPEYAAKKHADQQSYLWDHLIEGFAKNLARGTIIDPAEVGFAGVEQGIRIMAAEPRLMRRVLGGRLAAKLAKTAPDKAGTTAVVDRRPGSLAYAFLLMPAGRTRDGYDEYRQRRVSTLGLYCHLLKLEYPHVGRIVGIATEPRQSDGRSEDSVVLSIDGISPERERELRELQRKAGLIITSAERAANLHVEEYPLAPPRPLEPRPRRASQKTTEREQRRQKNRSARIARRRNR